VPPPPHLRPPPLSPQCVASPGRVVGSEERTTFFAAAAGVFNIGWAACQNSHQALVPELTPSVEGRVLLNSLRYSSMVAANLLVLTSMLVLLTSNAFGPGQQTEDSPATYKVLTGIVLGTGAVLAAAFLLLVRAPPLEKAVEGAPAPPRGKSNGEWLRTLDMYKTLLAYITMRMATNFTTLYMALFVTTTLGMDQGAIAAIPFLIFAASLMSVSQLKRLTGFLGLRGALTAGVAVFSVGSAGILLTPPAASAVMYPVALCLGAGLAAITVSVATLQSELLGDDTASAGFVFGIMSATDKLVVGIAVLGVQLAAEGQFNAAAPGDTGAQFYRYTLGAVPLACVGACLALALSLGKPRAAQAGGGGAAVAVAVKNPLTPEKAAPA
jgi:Na+/melibiose symporter-like transporter